jgi:hypothetical protein
VREWSPGGAGLRLERERRGVSQVLVRLTTSAQRE